MRGLFGDVTQVEGGNIKAGLHGLLLDYIQSTPTVNCGRSACLHLWQSRLRAFILTTTSVVCQEETAACIAERMRTRRPAGSVVVEAEGPWSCAGRAGLEHTQSSATGGLVAWCRSRMARPKQFCADPSVDVQSTFLERVVGSLPS